MTRWGPTRPAEEDVSDPPGIDLQSKRRRSRGRAWRTVSLTKPSLTISKIFDPTER
jgi:hypothetical protein